jgi:hypothetical protein
MTELFSVSEAAAIAEVSPETIRTAPEKKSAAPSFKRKTGKAVGYEFSVGDVLVMKVLVAFPFALSKTSGDEVFLLNKLIGITGVRQFTIREIPEPWIGS